MTYRSYGLSHVRCYTRTLSDGQQPSRCLKRLTPWSRIFIPDDCNHQHYHTLPNTNYLFPHDPLSACVFHLSILLYALQIIHCIMTGIYHIEQ